MVDLEGEEDAARALLAELGDGDMPETDIELLVALQALIEEAEAEPTLTLDAKLALFARAQELAGDDTVALDDFVRELDDVNPSLPELSQSLARSPPYRGVGAPPTQDRPDVASAALAHPRFHGVTMLKLVHTRIEMFSIRDSAREPPTEFRIAKAGLNTTLNGPYVFDAKAAANVLEAFAEHAAILPVDYDHLMLDPYAPVGGGKAAGWFKPEVRNGELWASEVIWTPAAAKALRDLEYRYMSPAFYTDDEGRMVRLINAALTNLPATHGLDPLVAASERAAAFSAANKAGAARPTHQGEAPMKLVLMALGLLESASEAEALSAVSKQTEALKEIATLVGVRSANEAIGALPVILAKAGRVDDAEAKATKLEKEVRVAKANKEIDAKIAGGFMRPDEREFGTKQAERDPEMFQGWLDQHKTKILNTSGSDTGGDVKTNKTNARTSVDKIDSDEAPICKQMGITDIEKYRAFKAKNGPVGAAPKDSEDESNEEAS